MIKKANKKFLIYFIGMGLLFFSLIAGPLLMSNSVAHAQDPADGTAVTTETEPPTDEGAAATTDSGAATDTSTATTDTSAATTDEAAATTDEAAATTDEAAATTDEAAATTDEAAATTDEAAATTDEAAATTDEAAATTDETAVTEEEAVVPEEEAAATEDSAGPSVATDKSDYAATETPAITATGFAPDSAVNITVTAPDGTVTEIATTASSTGEVATTYAPEGGLTDGFYTIEISDGNTIATATFSDGGGGPQYDLEQWANDQGSPDINDWTDNDLTPSNSDYAEGDVVPFMLTITNCEEDQTIMLTWDYSRFNAALGEQAGAYDYLTSYNVTETDVVIPNAASSDWALDGIFYCYGTTPDANGDIYDVNFTGPSGTPADANRTESVTFTINDKSGSSNKTVYVLFGAHLAQGGEDPTIPPGTEAGQASQASGTPQYDPPAWGEDNGASHLVGNSPNEIHMSGEYGKWHEGQDAYYSYEGYHQGDYNRHGSSPNYTYSYEGHNLGYYDYHAAVPGYTEWKGIDTLDLQLPAIDGWSPIQIFKSGPDSVNIGELITYTYRVLNANGPVQCGDDCGDHDIVADDVDGCVNCDVDYDFVEVTDEVTSGTTPPYPVTVLPGWTEIVGNGNDILEPGEVWEFTSDGLLQATDELGNPIENMATVTGTCSWTEKDNLGRKPDCQTCVEKYGAGAYQEKHDGKWYCYRNEKHTTDPDTDTDTWSIDVLQPPTEEGAPGITILEQESTFVLVVDLMGNVQRYAVDADGYLIDGFTQTSPDGSLTLIVPPHTLVLNPDGSIAQFISAVLGGTPAPPEGAKIIRDYQLTPNGITFQGNNATLYATYNPGDVPAGASLVWAYYDESAGKWVDMESGGYVAAGGETVANTLATETSHFTYFAIIAK